MKPFYWKRAYNRAKCCIAVRARCWLMSALYFKASCSPPLCHERGRQERLQAREAGKSAITCNEKPGYNHLGQWKVIWNKSRMEPNWLQCRWLTVSSYHTCAAQDGRNTQLCLKFLFSVGRESNRETLWGLATPLGVTWNNWAVPRTAKQTKSLPNRCVRDLWIEFVLLSGLPELIRKLPWDLDGLAGNWDQFVLNEPLTFQHCSF